MRRYSGRPELKPVNTQISIRGLKSASRQVSFFGTAADAGSGIAGL